MIVEVLEKIESLVLESQKTGVIEVVNHRGEKQSFFHNPYSRTFERVPEPAYKTISCQHVGAFAECVKRLEELLGADNKDAKAPVYVCRLGAFYRQRFDFGHKANLNFDRSVYWKYFESIKGNGRYCTNPMSKSDLLVIMRTKLGVSTETVSKYQNFSWQKTENNDHTATSVKIGLSKVATAMATGIDFYQQIVLQRPVFIPGIFGSEGIASAYDVTIHVEFDPDKVEFRVWFDEESHDRAEVQALNEIHTKLDEALRKSGVENCIIDGSVN